MAIISGSAVMQKLTDRLCLLQRLSLLHRLNLRFLAYRKKSSPGNPVSWTLVHAGGVCAHCCVHGGEYGRRTGAFTASSNGGLRITGLVRQMTWSCSCFCLRCTSYAAGHGLHYALALRRARTPLRPAVTERHRTSDQIAHSGRNRPQ